MPSVLRSVAAFAFVSAIAVLSAPGCSQQGEGQRCDSTKNGNADCDDGLVCIKKAALKEGITDLCCHEDAANDSASRCTRGVPNTNGSGGKGGSGGTSSSAGAAGDASGGTPTETNGGTPSETSGGTGAGGSPTTGDGGMSAAGTPAMTDGGSAAGAGIGGQGGAG